MTTKTTKTTVNKSMNGRYSVTVRSLHFPDIVEKVTGISNLDDAREHGRLLTEKVEDMVEDLYVAHGCGPKKEKTVEQVAAEVDKAIEKASLDILAKAGDLTVINHDTIPDEMTLPPMSMVTFPAPTARAIIVGTPEGTGQARELFNTITMRNDFVERMNRLLNEPVEWLEGTNASGASYSAEPVRPLRSLSQQYQSFGRIRRFKPRDSYRRTANKVLSGLRTRGLGVYCENAGLAIVGHMERFHQVEAAGQDIRPRNVPSSFVRTARNAHFAETGQWMSIKQFLKTVRGSV